ncbi:hypothetical protein NBG4_570017 [Candidatus Sulfobium mesophilum]|uniref:Uncharacterized protein n=1 Tax=Candidatus Sulfobium mesophilum TaxID=2016548 RepID=A0A2U3QJA8_9BACT|nr:hypothetical protein NBG4_570017 [Candidatus Sulfobium mesophilum]
MKARNKYKLLLFVDLIVSWGLLDPLEVVVFDHGFDSPESCSICRFLVANPMEADIAFVPVVKPHFVYPYVISEGRPQAIKALTLTAGTRGPPLLLYA